MKTIAIFALITLVACDTINPVCHSSVTVSPANPVQFWPIDCQTFNEKEVCGIYHRCYCQPWQCDDEIKFQGHSSEEADYDLHVLDENENVIDVIPIVADVLSFDPFDTYPLSTWTQVAGPDQDWTLGAFPVVTLSNLQGSDVIHTDMSELSAGVYDVLYSITRTDATGSAILNIRFYKSGVDIGGATGINIDSLSNSGSESVTLTDDPDEVRVVVAHISPVGTSDYTINYISIPTILGVTYSASFIPSDIGVCDEKIQLKVINTTASPDVKEFRSDCLDIRTEHECTNLIEYSNNRNYAGLVYDNVSPTPYFQIRVKSIFYEEEFPQEDFVMELSSSIEKTSSVITSQKLFEVDRMPAYMHKKLILIFNHSSVLIDGVYWTKQEKYIMDDNQKKTTPMKKGSVLLTMRDFVQRSVL